MRTILKQIQQKQTSTCLKSHNIQILSLWFVSSIKHYLFFVNLFFVNGNWTESNITLMQTNDNITVEEAKLSVCSGSRWKMWAFLLVHDGLRETFWIEKAKFHSKTGKNGKDLIWINQFNWTVLPQWFHYFVQLIIHFNFPACVCVCSASTFFLIKF